MRVVRTNLRRQNFRKLNSPKQNTLQQQNSFRTDREYIDAIHFWSNQMKENCMFLYLLITDEGFSSLKDNAYNLFDSWSIFLQKTFQYVQDDKVFLDETDFMRIVESYNFIKDEFLVIIKNTKQFFQLITDSQLSGEWIGCINLCLIEQMMFQITYINSYLQNEWINSQKIDEANFWNKMNGYSAGHLSKLLDLSEIEANNTLIKFFDVFINLHPIFTEPDEYVTRSKKHAEMFRDYLIKLASMHENRQLKSCINKSYLNHIMRENERSIHQKY